MTFKSLGMHAAGLMAALGSAGVAWAQDYKYGQPNDWQMVPQKTVTEMGDQIVWFHSLLFWIITAITLFVLALMVYIVIRFNEKANPKPSRTTHHTGLEIAWTVIPILILVAIAIPSFRILRFQLEIPKADVTIKAIGKQWYWTYEYPQDQGGFSFDQIMDGKKPYELAKGEKPKQSDGKPFDAEKPYLLAVDNEVVIPVNKVIVFQVTAADVLHAFAMPSFGVKIDAVPGRLNQTWFKATREGIYYGQCSELCGKDHAFMPIAIRVVSQERYQAWLVEAKKKYAALDAQPVRTATVQTNPQN